MVIIIYKISVRNLFFKIIFSCHNIHIESKENASNSFDQLCINYVNEQFQQFFTQRVLNEEKEWYEKEKIDVPFVPFFDNCGIIGIVARKTSKLI